MIRTLKTIMLRIINARTRDARGEAQTPGDIRD